MSNRTEPTVDAYSAAKYGDSTEFRPPPQQECDHIVGYWSEHYEHIIVRRSGRGLYSNFGEGGIAFAFCPLCAKELDHGTESTHKKDSKSDLQPSE